MKDSLLLAIFILFFSLFTTASCFAGEAKKQANFNSVNWKNVTVAEIQRLIRNGADVNANVEQPLDDTYLSYGWTPLMHAVSFSTDIKIIETLIKYGANVNAKERLKASPLMLAIKYNQKPQIIEFLLKHGAYVNATNFTNWTPLM